MTVTEYIHSQPEDRQEIMSALHDAIIANDKTVLPAIEPMMGKEMIIYKQKGHMKYGLSGVKKHMSLHCLPMYMNPALHSKYESLLPDAKFQKGCINFTTAAEVPVEVLEKLFTECFLVDIAEVLENRKNKIGYS
jgi:hypothetical protein